MQDLTKVLIVEDNQYDLELLEHELEKSENKCVFEVVKNEQDYCTALKNFVPDIILSDYSVPGFEGDASFNLREGLAPETPFIFISGFIGEGIAVEFIKRGVTDYVLKDKIFTLVPKVNRALREVKEKKEKKVIEFEHFRSEIRLKDAQSIAQMGSWEIDVFTNIQTWSDELYTIYGTTKGETHPSVESYLSFVHPDDLEFVNNRVKRAFETISDSAYDFRFIRKDGAVRHGYAKSHFEYDDHGKPLKRYGIIQDVTEKKSADVKLKKANRLYAFISQINQSIVHINEEEALLQKACDIAIEFGKFKMAWIGRFDDSRQYISLTHQTGMPKEGIVLFSPARCSEYGTQEQVSRTSEFYFCNNIEKEPIISNSFKPFARHYDISSLMVLPIKKSGAIIGTFNLYSSEANFFDTEEIALLIEVTDDISFALDIFEKAKKHKETEELVVRNECRFRAIIEKGTKMITLSSADGKLLYSSPAITTVFGYTEEEIPHLIVFDFIHPDDLTEFSERRNDILQTHGKSFYFTQRLLKKDGGWIWCEVTVTNMLHESGVNALVSNFRDISERKIAEEKQRFDRNNLHALINNTSDLMWSVDTELNLITSNSAFDKIVKQLTGYTIVKGINILLNGFSEEQLTRFRQHYKRALSGETFTEIEYTKLPFETWSEISYYPIYKDEEVVGTACFSRDITNQKKAEIHLRLLESVITNTNDAVLVTEAEPLEEPGPRIVYVNEAFTKMTGYTPEEVIGKTPRFLQGPKTDRAQLDRINVALFKRKSIEVEIVNYKKSGEEFWSHFTIVPVIEKNDQFTHCVSIQRDVTSRKRLDQIERSKLERLVEERTQELNEALQKEKELVEMKNKFVSIASHEFRTPLSTISIGTGFLRKYYLKLNPEEMDTKLANIEKQVNHMAYLLDDVLLVSKADAGKMQVNLSEVGIDTLERLAREVVGSIDGKHRLEVSTACSLSSFTSDEKLLRNIIINLITNAVKFSPDADKVNLDIKCDSKNLFITVRDSGIGIPSSDLKNLFSTFSRGSNVNTIEGTGLGLFIVKNACGFLHGKVQVKSELGKGSEFMVTLPLRYA